MAISLWQLSERLNQISIEQTAEQSINENADRAEELNREQLNAGVLADGSFFPNYSAKTVRKKREKNHQVFPMNLRDEGNFWAGITFKAESGLIKSLSTDSKYSLLSDRYGKQITGLAPKGFVLLKPYLQKSFNTFIANKIFR